MENKFNIASVFLFLTGILSGITYVMLRVFANPTFMQGLASALMTAFALSLFISVSIAVNFLYLSRWRKGKPLFGMFSMIIKHTKAPLSNLGEFTIIKEYMLCRLDAMPIVVFGYGFLTWWLVQPVLFTISFSQGELILSILYISLMLSYIIYVGMMGFMLYLDTLSKKEAFNENQINDMVMGIFK